MHPLWRFFDHRFTTPLLLCMASGALVGCSRPMLNAGAAARPAEHRAPVVALPSPPVESSTAARSAAVRLPDRVGPGHTQPSVAPAAPPASSAAAWSRDVPLAWRAFPQCTPAERLRQVVAARQAGERDVRVLRFLTDQVLPDRTQTAVLRNVVADLLSDADYDLPRVWAQHAAAAFHAEESEAWRDYAVQHLVQVAERAGRVPETSALLRQLMAGDGGLAGTALLLWSRQQEGSMAAPAAVSADSSPELATVARGLLERSTHAGAQGVAVSVLGRLGAAEDGPRIAAQLRASSPTVRRAALAALRVHPFGPSAAKLITRLAAADPDPSVRQVAASSASAPSAPRPPAAAGDTP